MRILKTMSGFKSDEFEIIVQDNTENNDEILDCIKSLNDDRIKYYHISEHICVSDNSDEGVKHANGKYICMIGDDDTICECMIDAAKFCDEHRIDAARYAISGFNWPGMTFVGKPKESNLFLNEKADGKVILFDAKATLNVAIKHAGGLDDMPRAYHGLVSKECMERIYKKAGSYFPGPSPDMGNAAAVCLESNCSAFINDYLIVSGYCYESARGEGNRQAHFGNLEDKPWLPKDIIKRWDTEIPPIFSGETIIADSLTESLKRMGREDLRKKYNYSSLYAYFLWNHKNAYKEMTKFLFNKPIRLLRIVKGFWLRAFDSLKCRILRKKPGNYAEYNNVADIQDALTIVNSVRDELHFSLELCKR